VRFHDKARKSLGGRYVHPRQTQYFLGDEARLWPARGGVFHSGASGQRQQIEAPGWVVLSGVNLPDAYSLQLSRHLGSGLEGQVRQGFEEHRAESKNVGACVRPASAPDLRSQYTFFIAQRVHRKIWKELGAALRSDQRSVGVEGCAAAGQVGASSRAE
jgi:hypothetical protein